MLPETHGLAIKRIEGYLQDGLLSTLREMNQSSLKNLHDDRRKQLVRSQTPAIEIGSYWKCLSQEMTSATVSTLRTLRSVF